MAKKTLAEETVDLGSRRVGLTIRRNPRARRLVLRIDKQTHDLVLTVPPGVSLGEARRFLDQHRNWALSGLGKLPSRVDFAPGATIPFLDELHEICHAPSRTGGVWREGARIHVTGALAHLPRRLTDWLKTEARRELADAARWYAGEIGRPIGRVTVRDTTSRWGSCSRAGNLSFSWRLILAPQWVLDYVAAHEVMHLIAMNHGDRFWTDLKGLCPRTDEAEDWLKTNGPDLHRYGPMRKNSSRNPEGATIG
jgi:predicted metal-dependent hydrolase